jgi:predicted ATPase
VRSAESKRYWIKLASMPPQPSSIRSVAFKNMAGLVDDEVTFSTPITALCGLNGVGKSSFLKLVWATVDWDSANKLPGVSDRLKVAQVETSFALNNQNAIRSYSAGVCTKLDPIPDNVPFYYFDAAAESIELQKFFMNVQSVPDVINGVDPIVLLEEQLVLLRYVTGKDYQSAEIYEVDAFEPMVPYFRVEDRALSYDVRSMSLGEISCLLLLWTLNRMRGNAVILLEEPETYISPVAQGCLMDLLVYYAVEKKMTFILTTHSPRMVKGLAPVALKFFVNSVGGSRIVTRVAPSELLRSIGLETPKRYLLLVEDRAAQAILSWLLSIFSRTLLQEAEIISMGGEAKIESFLSLFPRVTSQIRCIGIYDGDMRHRVSGNINGWPVTFMPFVRPVEAEFRELVRSGTGSVPRAFGIAPDDIAVAHSSLVGRDIHDWFEDFGRALARTYEQTVSALGTAWLEDTENYLRAQTFSAELDRLAQT